MSNHRSGFYLTKEEVLNFPPEAYKSTWTLQNAISQKYSCGVSDEVARRIIDQYNKAKP